MTCTCEHTAFEHWAVHDPAVSGLLGACMRISCDCEQFEQLVKEKA